MRELGIRGIVEEACDLIAKDAGYESFAAWCGDEADESKHRKFIQDEVVRLMDGDVKAIGLKQLQGLICRSSFQIGETRAHAYDDVPPALQTWNDGGCDVRIFSWGSLAAQRLFFGHTVVGNIQHLLRGHYDTTIGPTKEAASYQTITKAFGLQPANVLFLSDWPMRTAWQCRSSG